MLPVKPEDQNYYRGEIGFEIGFMYAIKIMECIVGRTTLVVNSCNNINTIRRATIHPEAVTLRRKQVDLISRLSDAYQSINSGMSMLHVHRHHDSSKLA